MGWRRWKDFLSSLCLARRQLLPKHLLESSVPLFWQWLLFWALYFAFYFVSHRVICLPASCCAPSSFPILPHMLIALLQSESQTVQGSLSHDCHKFATDSFPLLLPGKHLLVAWQLFTPLLIYKLKYIHSSASTGLILSKIHCSFNVLLRAIEIKVCWENMWWPWQCS